MTICTVSDSDLEELERLNKRMIEAKKGEKWQAQFALLSFLDAHPTIVPVCTDAKRRLGDGV